MEQREARHRLGGEGPVDDASLGSERPDGKAGRGSEHKLPFLAAVSSSEEGHPLRAKFSLVPGLTRKLLAEWARSPLVPGSTVRPAGLACCNAVSEAGGDHQPTVVDGRKLKERPEFKGGATRSWAISRPAFRVATMCVPSASMVLKTSRLSPTDSTAVSIADAISGRSTSGSSSPQQSVRHGPSAPPGRLTFVAGQVLLCRTAMFRYCGDRDCHRAGPLVRSERSICPGAATGVCHGNGAHAATLRRQEAIPPAHEPEKPEQHRRNR